MSALIDAAEDYPPFVRKGQVGHVDISAADDLTDIQVLCQRKREVAVRRARIADLEWPLQ